MRNRETYCLFFSRSCSPKFRIATDKHVDHPSTDKASLPAARDCADYRESTSAAFDAKEKMLRIIQISILCQ